MIRGKIHKHLSITLDYTIIVISRINMLDYIDEILTESDKTDPRNIGTTSSAAPENLFKVDEECEKLIPDKAKGLQNLVSKILYTNNMDRTDTCTSIALLTNRVKEPDTDICKKLADLMKYPRKKMESTTNPGRQWRRNPKVVDICIIHSPY